MNTTMPTPLPTESLGSNPARIVPDGRHAG